MMQVQRFIYGAIGLWVAIASSSLVQAQPLSSFPESEHPAIASSQTFNDIERMGLPRSAAKTLRSTVLRDYQYQIDNIRVVHVEPATWKGCNPDSPLGRFSSRSCETKLRQGWRVVVMGEFPSINQTLMRSYFVNRRSWAVASPLQDVTEEMRSHIATALQAVLENLKIIAASEETVLPATACPDQEVCSIPPSHLEWRILAIANGRDHIVRLGGIGAPSPTDIWFEETDQDTLGTLPAALANAVMRDAQERFNTAELSPQMAPDAPVKIGGQVESIESVTWNECGGGGPTQPMRGICPDITVSGWRMIVAGGDSSEPINLVYYIPEGADAGYWKPQPDGFQSLSEAVQRRIIAQVAKDGGVSRSNLRLFWADPRFFDGCLNTREGVPSCGTDIRPGWEVQVLVNQTTPDAPFQQPLWVYNTNITGTDVRLVRKGLWLPPP